MNTITTVLIPAIGNAKEIACPVCHVGEGERCKDAQGRVIAYHVERGRAARWAQMGINQ